jgi:Tfp pilus assembly protein PilO
MTTRDRLMLMGMGLVAVLVAAWLLAVSPAQKKASQASTEVASARTQLSQALTEVAEARSAQSHYHTAYASLVSLGQAVPTAPEVPSLVYALDKASDHHKVNFASIAVQGSSSSSSSSSSHSSSASGGAASTPFTQVPFAFTFTGSYEDLLHLLGQIESFTVQSSGGPLKVSGRLLTIQSITLAAPGQSSSSSSGSSAAKESEQSWTIDASAYVLAPGSTSVPAGAGSAGAPSSGGTSTGTSTTAATPAVVQANG